MIRLYLFGNTVKLRSQATRVPENVVQPRCGMLVAQVVVKASGSRKNRDLTTKAIKTVLATTYTTVRIACCPAVAHAPPEMAELDTFVITIASSGSERPIQRIGLAAEAMEQLRQSHRSTRKGRRGSSP
jgi:hypothetical protein